MEILSFEDGMLTAVFAALCALRMRTSMSAIGSVMLMRKLLLPAGLDHAGYLAPHRDLTQLVATEPELAEHAARSPRDATTVAQAHRRSVARQLLEFRPRLGAILVGALRVVDGREQRGT